MLAVLSEDAGDLESLSRADEVRRAVADDPRERINARLARLTGPESGIVRDLAELSANTSKVMPKGRNFQ
jgi:hypothetical protein